MWGEAQFGHAEGYESWGHGREQCCAVQDGEKELSSLSSSQGHGLNDESWSSPTTPIDGDSAGKAMEHGLEEEMSTAVEIPWGLSWPGQFLLTIPRVQRPVSV